MQVGRCFHFFFIRSCDGINDLANFLYLRQAKKDQEGKKAPYLSVIFPPVTSGTRSDAPAAPGTKWERTWRLPPVLQPPLGRGGEWLGTWVAVWVGVMNSAVPLPGSTGAFVKHLCV